MKYLRILSIVILIELLCVSPQLYANVFAHNIRVTQQGSLAPFDGRFSDGTGVWIRFNLADHADSVVTTIKVGATVVRTFTTNNLSMGDTLVTWNGKDNSNAYVSSNTFTVELKTYDKGYAAYTKLSYPNAVGLSMRGMTTVNNPALKNFGFIFDVDNGGFLATTGVGRFTADGLPWGDSKGVNKLTTTGIALGAGEARWASQADKDGYIYVAGRTAKQIYRYHTDSLVVQMVDSGYAFFPFGLAVMEQTVGKTIAVVTSSAAGSLNSDSKVLSFHINSASDKYFGAKDTLLKKAVTDSVMFWDVAFGRDSVMYVSFLYANGRPRSGVAKFNLKGKTFPMTMADTSWTVRADSGLVTTLSMYSGAAVDGSNDILYFVNARIASANPPAGQGIYALTGLNNSLPTKSLAYTDEQNNATSARSDISADGAGNIVYFENSNEEIAVISPPTGPNNFTTASSFSLFINESAISIAQAIVDGNKDFQPDSLGKTVTIIGTVNGRNTQTVNTSYTLQQDSAGIMYFSFGLGGPSLKAGDLVAITGAIAFNRGSTEIIPAAFTDVKLLGSGMPLTPVVLTPAQFLASPEKYESRLIKITGGLAKKPTSPAWPAKGSSANMMFWDGWDSVLVRMDSDTPVPGSTEPAYPVNIQGVGSQFTSSASVYNDGYQITPMDSTDFTAAGAVPPNPHFALTTPANGSTLKLDSAAQSFTFSWKKAFDLNGDTCTYQWVPIGFSAVGTGNAAKDTFLVRTGAQLRAMMAGADTVVLKWTVKAKGKEATLVGNIDTVSVKLVKGLITGVESNELQPIVFSLEQNYPNPFNPTTTILYSIPSESRVSLKIYNMLGQEVATLVNQTMVAGRYTASFNASNLASGAYIYRIEAGSFVSNKKMILLK